MWRRPRAWFYRQLDTHTLRVLALLFVAGATAVLWHEWRLEARLVETMTLRHAELYSEALEEFRTLYTSEVVERVRAQGIRVTHDYADTPGAIPLPATLSMLLGKRMAARGTGGQTRLYSPHPFPWRRETGGLRDGFERAAWQHLTQSPETPFSARETTDSGVVLRYATADRMRASCVACHNTHPDTPKSDWKEGDLRGVLEVVIPVEHAVAQAKAGLAANFFVVGSLSVLAVAGFGIIVHRFRLASAELERLVQDRTAKLEQTNTELTSRHEELAQQTDELLHETTHRKQAEAAAWRSEAEMRAVLESVVDAIISIDEGGSIQSFNAAAEGIFGYTTDEVMGRNVSMLMPSPHREAHDNYLARYLRTGEAKVIGMGREVVGRRQDGSTFPMNLAVSEVQLPGRRAFTGIVRDLTQQVELEERLRQAQKLEAVGALAAGIAHEINTPIQFVGDNTRFLQDSFTDLLGLLDAYQGLKGACDGANAAGPALAAVAEAEAATDLQYLAAEVPIAVDQTLDGVARVAKIVRAMRDFAHPSVGEKTLADLNQALETTLIVAGNELKYVAEVETHLDPALPQVQCDLGELNQVFLNLLVNAAHAIAAASDGAAGSRGVITVTTRGDGDNVVVQIHDTGAGIPAAIQERIFEPFFTTKGVGKGTGQGLAIARSVVVGKHGGELSFDSVPGRGTTFTIRLPVRAPDREPDA